jgi:tRNA(adenine34) deaminase
MTDIEKMQVALEQARLAALTGEVPVGAAIFRGDELIAVGRNAPIADADPTAHAEMVALREAARQLGNYRLEDCELFVTLEPCAMCSGALLNARLRRVVFGAHEPKTGAAGSVINLFANSTLNHQTHLQGGVLADDCAARLQSFFQERRQANAVDKRAQHPLRDDALRTPDLCFAGLPDYPWPAHYVSDLPALAGLRLHYLDVGPANATVTYLCLHDSPAWSYVFRAMIPDWVTMGKRVVAPDLPGFGKSDKPKKSAAHSLVWHQQVVLELVERLDLQNIMVVAQAGGGDSAGSGEWGQFLQRSVPGRYAGTTAWPAATEMELANAAYAAPFPDAGHRAALRA